MSLREVLTERSWRHLVEFVDFTLQPMLDKATATDERERVTDLHLIAFREIESLLKLAVDGRDVETFAAVDDVWDDIVDDPWWVWEEGPTYEEDASHTRIARSRLVSRMGIAMWAAHESAREQDPTQRDRLVQILRHVGAHFDTLDHLFLALEWALDEEHGRQWDTWYLNQLPERRAHSIPTRQHLVFATLLLAVDRIQDGAAVRPRSWMRDAWDTVDEILTRIASEHERWELVLGPGTTVSAELVPSDGSNPPAIGHRLDVLRRALERGREAADEARRDEIRIAAPGGGKRDELRSRLLSGFSTARVVRPLVARAGAFTPTDRQPAGYARQMLRTWLPKDLLVAEGRMVGIDFVARDLVRASVRAEIHEMLGALPDRTPAPSGRSLANEVRHELEDLRHAGNTPSLIVMPISWDARRSLELDPVSDALAAELHPDVTRTLEGTIEGVPVLDSPELDDRLWIVDLREAIHWEEWPSDEDSGLAFAIRFFDEAEAATMLAEHPEIREPGRTDHEVVQELRAKALVELALCFRARSRNPEGAVPVLVPDDMRAPRHP